METNVITHIDLNLNEINDKPVDELFEIENILDENILGTSLLHSKVNETLCGSIKNKKTYVQCPRKKKDDQDYCGYHCRAKKVVRYDIWLKSQTSFVKTVKKVVEKKMVIPKNIGKIICKNSKTKRRIKIKINEPTTLGEFMGSYRYLLIKQLHIYINKFGLTNIIGYVRKKKHILELLNKYNYVFHQCFSNLDKVIKLQSWFRTCIVQNRLKCNNESDFFMLEPLIDIPCGSFICLKDKDNFCYGFDITSLKECLKTNDKNPYNRNEFSENNIKKIRNFIKYIETRKGVQLDIEKDIFEPQKALEQKAVSIFHKFDMLGNYTDHMWFMNLNLSNLKLLYRQAEDMWNYRAQIPHEFKPQYVYGGKAFSIPFFIIDHMIEEQKMELQHIILDQFNRFATEGIDEDMRKLGVMLILSSLVMVSEDAANAMPQYIQNFA
jgi:hypothetical protein